MRKAGFLERVVLGAGLFVSSLGGCIGLNLQGIEPREGVYEASNTFGDVWKEEVKGGAVYSKYGGFGIINGIDFFEKRSDVVGNGCGNCDCPRDGRNVRGRFSSNEEYNYTVIHLIYCSPYGRTDVSSHWVSEIEKEENK